MLFIIIFGTLSFPIDSGVGRQVWEVEVSISRRVVAVFHDVCTLEIRDINAMQQGR